MSKELSQPEELLSAGDVAKRLGITPLQVSRLYERGFMPPAPRLARHRVIFAKDLLKLKEAAKLAGYLK